LIIGAETNLPYKAPRENITLLKTLTSDLYSSKLESESVRSLQNIFLVDNAEGRLDTSPFSATTPFNDLLHSNSEKIVPDAELHKDDIINIQ
jgi:5-methylcytosine-specific restriction endonuclease McrBC GTP-binding regulatory subunit McrB